MVHRIRWVHLLFDDLAASFRTRVGLVRENRVASRAAVGGHRGPLVRAQRLLGKKTRFADFSLSVYLGIHSNYIVKSGGVNSAGAGHAADHF